MLAGALAACLTCAGCTCALPVLTCSLGLPDALRELNQRNVPLLPQPPHPPFLVQYLMLWRSRACWRLCWTRGAWWWPPPTGPPGSSTGVLIPFHYINLTSLESLEPLGAQQLCQGFWAPLCMCLLRRKGFRGWASHCCSSRCQTAAAFQNGACRACWPHNVRAEPAGPAVPCRHGLHEDLFGHFIQHLLASCDVVQLDAEQARQPG